MRKFVINYSKQTSILEVEFEKVSPAEDLSVLFFKDGEWKGKISQPTSLYEKHPVTGKLSPPIWCWFVFYDSPEECFKVLRTNTRNALLKTKIQEIIKDECPPELSIGDYLSTKVEEVISKVQVVYLQ